MSSSLKSLLSGVESISGMSFPSLSVHFVISAVFINVLADVVTVFSIAFSSTLNTNCTSLYERVVPSYAFIKFSSDDSFDKYIVFKTSLSYD